MKFLQFLKPIVTRRSLIWSLTKRDVVGRYAGSMLGIVWTIIHPVMMIGIYWFVFGVGFKAQPMLDMPFVVWLTAGMLPWLLFSEIVSTTSNCLVENAGLIKKTVFPSQILVVNKILSALFTHFILLVLLFILMWAHGILPTISAFGIFYYLIGVIVMGAGIGWGVSALNIFVRDVAQLTGVIIQLWFWLTPIFWDIHIMPAKIHAVLKVNPALYFVDGYRESLLYGTAVLPDVPRAVLFWSFSGFLFLLGSLIFRRLQRHFGDVL